MEKLNVYVNQYTLTPTYVNGMNLQYVMEENNANVFLPLDACNLNSLYSPLNCYARFNGGSNLNIRYVVGHDRFFDYATDTTRTFFQCNTYTGPFMSANNSLQTQWMFYGCNRFSGVAGNYSKTSNTLDMFYNCQNLTGVGNYSNTKNSSWMFYNCRNLTSATCSIPYSVNTTLMFANCIRLKSSVSSVPNATNTSNMFYNCTNLTGSPISISSKVDNATYMYYNCVNITGVPSITPKSGVNLAYSFYRCTNLKGSLDWTSSSYNSVSNFYEMFGNRSSSNWINITVGKNLYMRLVNNGYSPLSNGRYWNKNGFILEDNYAKVRILVNTNIVYDYELSFVPAGWIDPSMATYPNGFIKSSGKFSVTNFPWITVKSGIFNTYDLNKMGIDMYMDNDKIPFVYYNRYNTYIYCYKPTWTRLTYRYSITMKWRF